MDFGGKIVVIPVSVRSWAVGGLQPKFESSSDPGNLFLCLCCSLTMGTWRRTYFRSRNNAGNMYRIYRKSRSQQVCDDSKVLDRRSVTHSSWQTGRYFDDFLAAIILRPSELWHRVSWQVATKDHRNISLLSAQNITSITFLFNVGRNLPDYTVS
jgi:hypothetical protein